VVRVLPQPPVPEIVPQGGLVAATVAKLRDAGQDESPEGLLVVELARQIMAGGHSAAGLASLSGAYLKALGWALRDVRPEADVIDVIFSGRHRRSARRARP
jgi:hypothetical protein